MAKTFTIEIEIDEQGLMQSTVKGIKGKKCSEASKFLDDMGKVTIDKPTAEMFQAEISAQQAQKR